MKPFTPSRGVTHFPDWSSIRNPHVGSPGISPLTPSWKRTRGLDLVLPSDSLPDDLPDHIGGWTLGSQNQTSKQHRGQKETHHWLLCQMAHCNPRKSWRPISWPHGCRFCASSILDSETWLTFVCGIHHRLLDFHFCHDVEDPISSRTLKINTWPMPSFASIPPQQAQPWLDSYISCVCRPVQSWPSPPARLTCHASSKDNAHSFA